MVEILTRYGFDDAVKALDLTSAVCTYQYQPYFRAIWPGDFQVWALSDEDFINLTAADWDTAWGNWWQYDGNGVVPVGKEFYINEYPIKAWDGSERRFWCIKCDYATQGRCSGTEDDKDRCYSSHRYKDLISYLNDELGIRAVIGMEFCAYAASLAKQNGMRLSELFQQYLG